MVVRDPMQVGEERRKTFSNVYKPGECTCMCYSSITTLRGVLSVKQVYGFHVTLSYSRCEAL